MKNIMITVVLLLAMACKAQQPISTGNTKQIKALGIIFNVKKITTELGNKYIEIANTANKLANVKQVTPKMSPGMSVVQYISYDKDIITKICANVIPLTILKKMTVEDHDWLSILIRFDSSGYPIELQFLIRQSSLISADDLAKIEIGVKKSAFRVTFKKEIQSFLPGANYFFIDLPIKYTDMLKVKLGG